MKNPWETWVLKGLSINEAAPLFEKMERMQMTPWGHAFGWKNLTLADGRKVKLTIQKNGPIPIYTAIASEIVTVRDIFSIPGVEHGFMVWPIEANIIYPLSVYIDTTFMDYIIAGGTVLPPKYTTKNPIIEEASGTGICSMEWKNTPVVDTYNRYESQIWTDSFPGVESIDSRACTGLLRLAVQAKIGAGKNPKELSKENSFSGGSGAILVDPDSGAYWFATITSGGMYAFELSTPKNMQCLFDEYYAGQFLTDTDKELIQSYFLGYAVPKTAVDGNDIPALELLSPEDMAAVTITGLPVSGGWSWNQDGSKGIMVCHNTIGTNPIRLSYTVWRISVEWLSGIPSATLTRGEQGTWSGRGVMVEYLGIGWLPWLSGIGTAPYSEQGILWGWYTKDGAEILVKHGYEQITSLANKTLVDTYNCGPGEFIVDGYNSVTEYSSITPSVGSLYNIVAPAAQVGTFTYDKVEVFSIGTLYHEFDTLSVAPNTAAADTYFNFCGGWDATTSSGSVDLYGAMEELGGAIWTYRTTTKSGGYGLVVVGKPIDQESAVVLARAAPYSEHNHDLVGDYSAGIQNVYGGGFHWKSEGFKDRDLTQEGFTSYFRISTQQEAGSQVASDEYPYTNYDTFLGGALVGRDRIIHEWPPAVNNTGPWGAWWSWTGLTDPVSGPYLYQSHAGRALYEQGFNEFVAPLGMQIFDLPEGQPTWQYGRWIGGI